MAGNSLDDTHTLTRYRLQEDIGGGTYGTISKYLHLTTNVSVAVKNFKKMKLKKGHQKRLSAEIEHLALLFHPHIITFFEMIEVDRYFVMVMEYAERGDLKNYLHFVDGNRFTEEQGRLLFQQLVAAVHYCHQHSIVHHDIKLENILLNRHLEVKLADFGESVKMREGRLLRCKAGTRGYMAPEVEAEKPHGKEIDVWSCGVCLYLMLQGTAPFAVKVEETKEKDKPSVALDTRKKVQSPIIEYVEPTDVSESVINLLSRLITVDPRLRITIDKVKEHEWFKVDLPKSFISKNTASEWEYDSRIIRAIAQRLSMPEDRVQQSLSLLENPNTHYDIAAVAVKILLTQLYADGKVTKKTYEKMTDSPDAKTTVHTYTSVDSIAERIQKFFVALSHKNYEDGAFEKSPKRKSPIHAATHTISPPGGSYKSLSNFLSRPEHTLETLAAHVASVSHDNTINETSIAEPDVEQLLKNKPTGQKNENQSLTPASPCMAIAKGQPTSSSSPENTEMGEEYCPQRTIAFDYENLTDNLSPRRAIAFDEELSPASRHVSERPECSKSPVKKTPPKVSIEKILN